MLNSDDERDAVAALPDLDVAPFARDAARATRTDDALRANAPSDARRLAAPQRQSPRSRLNFASGSSWSAADGLSSESRIGCVPVAQLDRALVS